MIAERVVDRLREAGCVYAEDEAALLLETAADTADLERLVEARVAGQPLEQLLGWVSFGGLRVAVGPGVFVPRVRTELLAERAVALVDDGSSRGGRALLRCGRGQRGAAAPAAEG